MLAESNSISPWPTQPAKAAQIRLYLLTVHHVPTTKMSMEPQKIPQPIEDADKHTENPHLKPRNRKLRP